MEYPQKILIDFQSKCNNVIKRYDKDVHFLLLDVYMISDLNSIIYNFL